MNKAKLHKMAHSIKYKIDIYELAFWGKVVIHGYGRTIPYTEIARPFMNIKMAPSFVSCYA